MDNIVVNFLSISGLILYLTSYYFLCYKKGYKFDLWHMALLISLVVPFFIISFFSYHINNMSYIGASYYSALLYILPAFIINLIGFTCLYLGLLIHDLYSKKRIKEVENSYIYLKTGIKSFFTYSSMNFFNNLMCCLVLIIYGYFTQKYGFTLNFRTFLLNDDLLRPIFNFTLTFANIFILANLSLYVFTKKKYYIMYALVFCTPTFFSGSRSSLLWPIVYFIVVLCIFYRHKIKMIPILLLGLGLFGLALMLSTIRSLNVVKTRGNSTMDSILYGNNFSDLRDFGWLLSGFNESYLYGKTYLAALLTFIPSSISDFRSEFSYARATLKFVGIDPNQHAGLRGGIFAESYFNFGLLGVVMAGIIFGFILRFLDVKMKNYISNRQNSDIMDICSVMTMYSILQSLMITSGFWKAYFVVAIGIGGLIISSYNKKFKVSDLSRIT